MKVVCGVIMQDDKFLIAKRGKGVDAGYWEFPGGKIEYNETNEEAVVRELKEELDLDVKVLFYLTTIEDSHHEEVIEVSAYLCKIMAGELQLHVHEEACWVTAEELLSYKFQQADMPILNLLRNIKNR